jgi:hypothetical protein
LDFAARNTGETAMNTTLHMFNQTFAKDFFRDYVSNVIKTALAAIIEQRERDVARADGCIVFSRVTRAVLTILGKVCNAVQAMLMLLRYFQRCFSDIGSGANRGTRHRNAAFAVPRGPVNVLPIQTLRVRVIEAPGIGFNASETGEPRRKQPQPYTNTLQIAKPTIRNREPLYIDQRFGLQMYTLKH